MRPPQISLLVFFLVGALLVPTGANAAVHRLGTNRSTEPRHHQRHARHHHRHAPARKAKHHRAPATPAAPVEPTTPSAPTDPTAPAEPEGQVTFLSGFDGSFAGWYVQSLSYRATINPAHPEMGSGAGRFEVLPGDAEPDTGGERSEVSGPSFHEGQNIFIRDDFRIPMGYSFQGAWQLINQLHEKNYGGSPGTATFLDASRRISFTSGDGSQQFWHGPQLEQERWYDLVFRLNLSQNPSQGYVELWLDGVQQTLSNGQMRMYGKTIQMPENYLKVGVFRSPSSSGASILEHDNVVVGTSLASVMAA